METLVKSSIFSSSPAIQSLDDQLQTCLLGHTRKNNFLNCNGRINHHQMCRAAAAVGLGNGVECRMGSSRTRRADENHSSASLFDHVMRQSEEASPRNVDDGAIYSTTKKRRVDKEEDVSRKLDQWVKDSVVEILNYLDEAPFLIHIYSDGEEGSASANKSRLVKEKAAAENWSHIKERWGGASPTPNGIILVEEMESGEPGDSPDQENWKIAGVPNKQSSSTKIWGLLIQGKGANYPACYILKTCRVPSGSGFCTHFCLVRVECFAEHVNIQFKKSWLL